MTPQNSPLLGKTAWSGLASVVAGIGSAASTIVLARLLGPTGTGDVTFLVWLATTASTIAGLGMPQAMTRFVAEAQGKGGGQDRLVVRWFLRRISAFFTPLSALLALGGLLLIRGPHTDVRWVWAMLILAAAQPLAAAFQAAHTGLQDFRKLALVNGLSAVLQVCGVILGSLSGGVPGALYGYAAGCLLPAGAALLASRKAPPGIDATLAGRVGRYALHTWVAVAASMVTWSRLEVLFLDRYWGQGSVAMFSVGMSIAQLATQTAMLLGGALLPHFAQLVGGAAAGAASRTYTSLTVIVGFAVIPLCLGLAALTPLLVPLVFGARFAEAVPAAVVIVGFTAVNATASVGSSYTYALERSGFIAKTGVLFAVVTPVAYWAAIPKFGLLGAAATRGVVQCAAVAIGAVFIGRALRTHVPAARLGRITIAAGISAGAAFLMTRWRVDWLGLLAAALVMVASYALLSRPLRCLGPDELDKVERSLSALPLTARRAAGLAIIWLRC